MGNEMPSELSQLIEDNLELVKHVVFQVAVRFPRHVDREELSRAGALGLVEAAQRYDESRGVPFKRFAAVLESARRRFVPTEADTHLHPYLVTLPPKRARSDPIRWTI